MYNNIASAFAQVVPGGIVVESDGVVSSNSSVESTSKSRHKFTSKYGWYLYKKSGNKTTCYSTKGSVNKTITIQSILNYLVNENLVRW